MLTLTSVSLDFAGFGRLVREERKTTMPKGPQGQKRPADTIGNAVMIAQIATGEVEDNKKSGRVNSGKAGAKARAQNLTSEERSDIAKKAAAKRWA